MTLIKTSVLSAIATIIKIISGFVINKVVAIYIGPSGLAIIGQLQNFMELIITFSNGAITNGVVKYTAEYQTIEQKKRIFSTSIIISFVCSLLISIFLFGFSEYLSEFILKDVHYYIDLHFKMTEKANAGDNPGKFKEMLSRRARKGQCYHQPYLGCREFPASFRLVEDDEVVQVYPESRDLGYMLYDMNYSDREHISPRFFRAKLESGVLYLKGSEVHQ